ncbi:MAG: diguanylate cyclase, partial [Burkholderiales bacterium]|nr:diguanylate cyclase [Burkholderiales bacterium]
GLELLRVAIEEQKGGGTTLAVCMADIDKFKAINDRFGHQVGDQVLRKVTATIVGSLRSEDLVCRYGGDEFLLAIQDTSCERLSEIVKRVAQRVGEAPVRTRSGDVPVTLSIGVALSGCGSNET